MYFYSDNKLHFDFGNYGSFIVGQVGSSTSQLFLQYINKKANVNISKQIS